jgi:hypothetical protein
MAVSELWSVYYTRRYFQGNDDGDDDDDDDDDDAVVAGVVTEVPIRVNVYWFVTSCTYRCTFYS